MGKAWKEEEDAIILDFVLKNGKHWDMIASLLPHRTTSQISAHWEKCLDPSLTKGPFTPQEDEAIINFVKEHGPQNWPLIKEVLPARSPKQCRERWYNHLNPDVSKKEWSAEEDNFIFLAVMQFGPKWSNIAKLIPGRTDNSIKNRFNSSIMKRIYHDPNTGRPSLVENKKRPSPVQLTQVPSSQQSQITQSPPSISHSQLNNSGTFQINILPSKSKTAPFVLPIISAQPKTEIISNCNTQSSNNFKCKTNTITSAMNISNPELQPEPGFSLDNFGSLSYGSSSTGIDNSMGFKPEPGFLSSFEPNFEMQFPAEAFLASSFDDGMIDFSEI